MAFAFLIVNKTKGLQPENRLDSAVITEMQKSMKLNYNYSFNRVQESEFFSELPQQLQAKLLKAITKLERKNFQNVFKDIFLEFKMPTGLVNQLLANMTCREVYFDSQLYAAGDELKHFYLIKSGEVKFLDKNYDYMYHLGPGSYFGDIENIFGLYS